MKFKETKSSNSSITNIPTSPFIQAKSQEEPFFKPVNGETELARPVNTHYLSPAKTVVQDHAHTCWAAALESFQSATAHPNPGRQADFIRMYRYYRESQFGAISVDRGWQAIARDMGLTLRKFDPKRVTPLFIANLLRSKGHLLLLYNVEGTTFSHTVVVSGIGYPDGKTMKLVVSDPDGGVRRKMPMRFLQTRRGLVGLAYSQ